MREIVFRGKRVDNGEWTCGSLLVDEGGNHYIGTYLKSSKCDSFVAGGGRQIGKTLNRFVGIGFSMVDPETVGQDTGIRIYKDDPDGDTEITFVFEGDIIRATDRFNNAVLYAVEYKDGAYMLRQKGVNYHVYFNDLPQKYYQLEVIGNTHDDCFEDA